MIGVEDGGCENKQVYRFRCEGEDIPVVLCEEGGGVHSPRAAAATTVGDPRKYYSLLRLIENHLKLK